MYNNIISTVLYHVQYSGSNCLHNCTRHAHVTWLCLPLQDLIEPAKGFVMDGAIVIRAHIVADAPHGIKCVSE